MDFGRIESKMKITSQSLITASHVCALTRVGGHSGVCFIFHNREETHKTFPPSFLISFPEIKESEKEKAKTQTLLQKQKQKGSQIIFSIRYEKQKAYSNQS